MKRDTLIALALFALSFWHYLGYVDTTIFHRDEARWVGRAYFIDELFNPDSETWDDGLLTRGQPPLGSYLMGIGLTIQGHDTTTTRGRLLYDFNRSEAWNRLRGRIPSREDIDAGRRTNSFVGALTVAFAYLVGRRMLNRTAGVVAALILLPHPLQVYLSSLAGSDALLALLVVLAGLVAIQFAERPAWWRAILIGVLLGLGAATKLSPLITAGLVAAYGMVLLLNGRPWLRKTEEARRTMEQGWMLLTVPFVAFATFVATYPYLWRDPIRHTINLFTFRSEEMEIQGELWEDRRVLGIPDALSRIKFRLGEQWTTMDWLSPRIAERFGIEIHAPWLDLALGTLGIGVWLLLAVMFGLKSKYSYGALLIVGQATVTIVGMQADFERYHLPILIALCLGAGVLVAQVVAVAIWVWSWVTGNVRRLRLRGAQPAPAPAASLAPSPAASLAPSPAASLAPSPAASLAPAPVVTTSAPVGATPSTADNASGSVFSRPVRQPLQSRALAPATVAPVSGGANGHDHADAGQRAIRTLAGGIFMAAAVAVAYAWNTVRSVKDGQP